MQLYGSFQDLRQWDNSVSAYLHQAKVLFDELAAAGWPLSLEDFNFYIFRGLRGDFKDLVTSLSTWADPLSYSDLHNYLLTYEYLNKSSLQSTLGSLITAPLLLTPSHPTTSTFLAQHGGFDGPSGHSYHRCGRHRDGWKDYRGGNYGTSRSGWQQMFGSGFQQGSRESGTSWEQHSRGFSNSSNNF